jgi:hypothetical protein
MASRAAAPGPCFSIAIRFSLFKRRQPQMSDPANKTITRHLHELDRRLKKIQQIHIAKKRNISGLKLQVDLSATPSEKIELDNLDATIDIRKKSLQNLKYTIFLLEGEDSRLKTNITIIEARRGVVKREHDKLQDKMNDSTQELLNQTKIDADLKIELDKAQKATSDKIASHAGAPPTPAKIPTLAPGAAKPAGGVGNTDDEQYFSDEDDAAATPSALGGAKPAVVTETAPKGGGGGWGAGIAGAAAGAAGAVMGLLSGSGAKKQELQAAAVEQLPEKQPVPELTHAKTAIEEEADKMMMSFICSCRNKI